MIILDTNVISEMMKHNPDIQVIKWIDQQKSIHLFVTTISIAEIQYGLHALPQGKRRLNLTKAFEAVLNTIFKYRILNFDQISAHCYGELMGKCKLLGHPMSILDGQIAAIAQTRNMQLATRNISDFHHLELELINPFK